MRYAADSKNTVSCLGKIFRKKYQDLIDGCRWELNKI